MIELRDLESINDLDKMKVLFFDDDTLKIIVGENVKIIGNIEVVESRKTNGDSVSMLFAGKVDYESEQEMKLEDHDIDEILQFKSESDESGIIPRLIELTATSVIGHDLIKEGMLLSAANTVIDDHRREGNNPYHYNWTSRISKNSDAK